MEGLYKAVWGDVKVRANAVISSCLFGHCDIMQVASK